MPAKISIVIDPDGSVQIAVNGVKGKKCKELTSQLEKALGTVTSTSTTPEYNETEVINVTTGQST